MEKEITKKEYTSILKDNPNLIKDSVTLSKVNLTIYRQEDQPLSEYFIKKAFNFETKKSKYWKRK